ncbi:MAG: O-acetyl-ADP-ribose deacetylase [bacterium]|jgi:O-acetyl-ADP-ribose deacetylase (regulator of RNase III)
MKIEVNDVSLDLVQGDITRQNTDAIVNAANSSLLGGGGVDGAIHRAGGPQILEECRKLNGCETGNAKITGGGKLAAKYVIHAVGPVYHGGASREAELLASCYRRSLEIAREKNLQSIAFPSISTGAYGYPVREAARVALSAVRDFLQQPSSLTLIRFVLFDQGTYQAYEQALKEVFGEKSAGLHF